MNLTENQTENQMLAPTKRERRLFKRQDEARQRLRRIKIRKLKKIAVFVLPIILIGGITVFLIARSESRNSASIGSGSGQPRLEISPQEYELGNVSMAAGLVKKTYTLKNTGSADLVIEDIRTSCHCTTAILKAGGQTSPEFGMEGSVFWSQKLPAGQTGELEVIFDSAFHGPQGIGQAVREIYLSTNDPLKPKTQVQLSVNVIP